MEQLKVDEFRILVKAMKSVYSKPDFIADEDAFKTWFFLLKDIPYQILQTAVQVHMQSSVYPPTIADLRIASAKLKPSVQELTELEAWAIVRTALSRSGYYYEEEFEKLPYLVRKVIGRAENLREWSQMQTDTVESVIQSQFLRSYRAQVQRNAEISKLAPQIRERLEYRHESTITTTEGNTAGIPENI